MLMVVMCNVKDQKYMIDIVGQSLCSSQQDKLIRIVLNSNNYQCMRYNYQLYQNRYDMAMNKLDMSLNHMSNNYHQDIHYNMNHYNDTYALYYNVDCTSMLLLDMYNHFGIYNIRLHHKYSIQQDKQYIFQQFDWDRLELDMLVGISQQMFIHRRGQDKLRSIRQIIYVQNRELDMKDMR